MGLSFSLYRVHAQCIYPRSHGIYTITAPTPQHATHKNAHRSVGGFEIDIPDWRPQPSAAYAVDAPQSVLDSLGKIENMFGASLRLVSTTDGGWVTGWCLWAGGCTRGGVCGRWFFSDRFRYSTAPPDQHPHTHTNRPTSAPNQPLNTRTHPHKQQACGGSSAVDLTHPQHSTDHNTGVWRFFYYGNIRNLIGAEAWTRLLLQEDLKIPNVKEVRFETMYVRDWPDDWS